MKTLEELIKDNDWINISEYPNLSEEFCDKYRGIIWPLYFSHNLVFDI